MFQEVLDNSVRMFVSVLRHHATSSTTGLERPCIGLVGAGEAVSTAIVGGQSDEAETIQAFSSLIQGGLREPQR